MITELARLCRLGRVVSPLSLVLGFVWGSSPVWAGMRTHQAGCLPPQSLPAIPELLIFLRLQGCKKSPWDRGQRTQRISKKKRELLLLCKHRSKDLYKILWALCPLC